jgi:hypothetical protein
MASQLAAEAVIEQLARSALTLTVKYPYTPRLTSGFGLLTSVMN